MSSTSFTLFGVPGETGICRLGITVTKKIGGAVRRNRIKRMIREVFRSNRHELVTPVDLVILVKRGIEERAVVELQREFLRRFGELVRRLDR